MYLTLFSNSVNCFRYFQAVLYSKMALQPSASSYVPAETAARLVIIPSAPSSKQYHPIIHFGNAKDKLWKVIRLEKGCCRNHWLLTLTAWLSNSDGGGDLHDFSGWTMTASYFINIQESTQGNGEKTLPLWYFYLTPVVCNFRKVGCHISCRGRRCHRKMQRFSQKFCVTN